jgi:hypothetical protein
MHGFEERAWRHYGFGGPPEPWERGAQRDLDRLATSYYLDILESRATVLDEDPLPDVRRRVEELFTDATRHKHEIDFTLRHWATPAEHARIEDRLGQLMRISRRFHALLEATDPDPDPQPADAAKLPRPAARAATAA